MIIYLIATVLAIFFAILLGVKYGIAMAEAYYESLADGGSTQAEDDTDKDKEEK